MTDARPDTRFPGYDVLDKRRTPSWNDQTRQVIDARLALPATPTFLTQHEYETVRAIAAHIVPQPPQRPAIPIAALVDHKLRIDRGDGYRDPDMPRDREAWRGGLAALDAEARARGGVDFICLAAPDQADLLARMSHGDLRDPAWNGIEPKKFFSERMAKDIVYAYYAHPTAWSEIGWGGPASPRGYVRMDFNERDPWEAAEVKDNNVAEARRKNQRV